MKPDAGQADYIIRQLPGDDDIEGDIEGGGSPANNDDDGQAEREEERRRRKGGQAGRHGPSATRLIGPSTNHDLGDHSHDPDLKFGAISMWMSGGEFFRWHPSSTTKQTPSQYYCPAAADLRGGFWRSISRFSQ
jgi:hypothetical protein